MKKFLLNGILFVVLIIGILSATSIFLNFPFDYAEWKINKDTSDILKDSTVLVCAKDSVIKNLNDSISIYEVPITMEDDCMYVTVELNGIPMKMIFDTGCTKMRISPIEYWFMVRQGKIDNKNFMSEKISIVANGQEEKVHIYNIDSVKIGSKVIKNVECIVSLVDSTHNTPLLIGQSVISKLGKISIDYDNKKLIMN